MALVVAGLGGTLQGTANLWQIYELTGSALQLGLTGLARAIPILAFSLIGGVIADRIERRKIIMFTQFTAGVFALILGILSVTGLIEVWHIYVLTFISAGVNSASLPARDAITANLVPRHHLMNAIGLNTSVNQIARIAGPSIAGLLIAYISLPLTYLLTGIAYVLTFLAITRIYLGPAPARPRGNPWESLIEGLSFVRARPIILTILAIDVAMNVFGSYQALLPILADRLGTGAAGFGLLSSAPGLGALIGTAVIVSFGDPRYKGFIMTGAALAFCVWLVGLALSPWFILSVACTFLLGASDAVFTNPRGTLIQLMTPDELRGRVSSFRTTLTTSSPSLGQSAIGAAATLLTPPIALIAGAALCATFTIATFARSAQLRSPELGTHPEVIEPSRPG